MGDRLALHEILVSILGSRYVYFQPPSSVQIRYPCIIYSRSSIDTKHANNRLYKHKQAYTATVIDADPDSEIPGRLLTLPYCRPDRHFTADNLNHDVFTIYY